jgi:hypothetical protein
MTTAFSHLAGEDLEAGGGPGGRQRVADAAGAEDEV